MRRHSFPIMLVAVALGTLAPAFACSSVQRPAAEVPCIGEPMLVVRNETGAPVEVYIVRGATHTFVGTAPLGRIELSLPPGTPPDASFQGRRPDGTWIAHAYGGRSDARRLEFDVQCRLPPPESRSSAGLSSRP